MLPEESKEAGVTQENHLGHQRGGTLKEDSPEEAAVR